MAFLTSFIESIKLPKKKSVFKLNRISMDSVVVYMFILLALVSLPSLFYQMSNSSELSVKIGSFFYLFYFFIFLYFVIVVLVFIVISIIFYFSSLFTMFSCIILHFSIFFLLSSFFLN